MHRMGKRAGCRERNDWESEGGKQCGLRFAFHESLEIVFFDLSPKRGEIAIMIVNEPSSIRCCS